MKRILVIGGGASGMMAAIFASNSHTEISIYEKNDKIGKKILATGNGKCNLTNADLQMDYYYAKDKEKLSNYFKIFSNNDTLQFFREAGLLLRERDGYYYPHCEQASVVLDVLINQLENKNVTIHTSVTDIKVKRLKEYFEVYSSLGKEQFDAVIIACGSRAGIKNADFSAYQIAKDFQHHIEPLVPALVQIRCNEKFFKSVAGVRAKCEISMYKNDNFYTKEKGELQLTDYGVSGIPVFQISREVAYALKDYDKIRLSIDFVPEFTINEWLSFSKNRINQFSGQNIKTCLTGTIHKKLIELLIKEYHLDSMELITNKNKKQILQLLMNMKDFSVTPKEVNPFENAQVSAGGVSLLEVNHHLESLKQKGLYFCGEILDVDGKCGGYNLQWAWTSGAIAGKDAGN